MSAVEGCVNVGATCPFPGFSLGISTETTEPYFWHSSFMSSKISVKQNPLDSTLESDGVLGKATIRPNTCMDP